MPSIVDSLAEVGAGLGRVSTRARGRLTDRRALAERTAAMPAVLAAIEGQGVAPARNWIAHPARRSDTGVIVVPIGPKGEAAQLVVKLADSGPALAGLRSQDVRLARLHEDPRLAGLAALAPRVVASGTAGTLPWFAETALRGRPGTELLREAGGRGLLLAQALGAIATLHESTAVLVRVDDAMLESWLDEPLRAIAALLAGRRDGAVATRGLTRVRDELRAGFLGREAAAGWVHGDFWPGNVLVRSGAERAAAGSPPGSISGIVDWDLADDRSLGIADLVHFVLLTRRLVTGRDLGVVVSSTLVDTRLDPDEQSAFEGAGADAATWRRDGRPAVLLAWLRHAGFFATVPNEGGNPRWVRRNVVRVLDELVRSKP